MEIRSKHESAYQFENTAQCIHIHFSKPSNASKATERFFLCHSILLEGINYKKTSLDGDEYEIPVMKVCLISYILVLNTNMIYRHLRKTMNI